MSHQEEVLSPPGIASNRIASHSITPLLRSWLALLAIVLAGACGPPAAAANMPELRLHTGQGQLLILKEPAESVFVANPEIADVQISGPRAVLVFGVHTGRTTLYALASGGRTIIARTVRVEHDLVQLREILDHRFPGHSVTLTSAPKTLLAAGTVATPRDAEAIIATLRGMMAEGETVIDRLQVETPTQVNIRVRIVEVSRNIDQRLGFNWQALLSAGDFVFGVATGRDFIVPAVAAAANSFGETVVLPTNEFGSYLGRYRSGRFSLDAMIDALDEEGLARTLAEPNLTAVSGQVASFIAGGEFPIPVAQDNNRTTIEFKPFGVVLDFTPTVLSADRISLNVRPEVSDLSQNGAIEINGFRVPALTVRRVETTVELGSGQSLVLAGLLQQSTRDVVQKLPGIGDIPVLGTLFTSSAYQKNETELVVIVPPYVVRPTHADTLETPLGRYGSTRPLERYLRRHHSIAAVAGAPKGRLHGPAGFIY